MLLIRFTLLISLMRSLFACYLWGTDSGECSLLTFDPVWKSENMPFCSGFIDYSACIPKFQEMPPTRDFPEGRWFNHTTLKKDQWVQTMALQHIGQRVGYERNRTLKNTGRNEYGDVGITKVRFDNNPDCQHAFISYFCWINFPRCDPQTDTTLPTCKSCCENFFHSCNYDHDLWRCGPSAYFNGYSPEQPRADPSTGGVSYLRDYFPGQPFVSNKFDHSGNEIPICTPALNGASSHSFSTNLIFFTISVVITIFLLVDGVSLGVIQVVG